MKTISSEQFKKIYGNAADDLVPSIKPPKSNLVNQVGEDINNRVDRVSEILSRPDTSIVTKAVQTFGQGAGMAANALEKTVEQIPGVKPIFDKIGAGINWLATSESSPIKNLGEVIGSQKGVQEIVNLYDTDNNFRDSIDAFANSVRLGADIDGIISGANFTKNVTEKIATAVEKNVIEPTSSAIKNATSKVTKGSSDILSDITPTSDRIINTEITKALDLTQGDVKNISLKTGNDVGKFVADKNLIGPNVDETLNNIKSYFSSKYKEVRSEIGKVKIQYLANEIPQYKEALKSIKSQINDVPGLKDVNLEVDNLLKKKAITLNDVQRTKELLDEHFSLYKATGDVSQGVAKQGLTNIRSNIQKFIENSVKENTGADIQALNNEVSTARSIQDAIETRSTRGLTRSTISPADILTFLTGTGASGGNPLVGGLAVLVKKVYQSPSFKLRVSRWLDNLSDSRKLRIQKELESGSIPEDLKDINNQLSETPSNVSTTQEKNPMKINNSLNKNDLTMKDSIEQGKSLVKRAVDKYMKIPNKEGGFVKIGGMTFKEVLESNKREMIEIIDYLRLGKDINPSLERSLALYSDKYNINQDWSNSKIANTFERLVEDTKTK